MDKELGPAPSTAAIRGHPIHPMIVPLPIGFLVGALMSDLGYARTGDPFWARASRWLIASGLVTGLAAAPSGSVDFLTIARARRREGWIHAVGNSAVMAVTAANLLARRGEPGSGVFPAGVMLSGAAAALLGVTGWMGGELSYRHRIGVMESTTA